MTDWTATSIALGMPLAIGVALDEFNKPKKSKKKAKKK